MDTTSTKQGGTERETYNQQLIVGLWNIRNRYPLGSDLRKQTRDWLRQTIRLERKRQGR